MEQYYILIKKKIFKIAALLFSIYIFFISVSVWLNSSVNIEYTAYSNKDIEYVQQYSMLVIIYIVFMLIFTFRQSSRHSQNTSFNDE